MLNKIRTAVIGVGSMGKNHARVYSEISNLVAVADLNIEVAKKIAEEFHINYYDDYQKMLRVEHPQAVSVVVPTTLHRQVVVDCLSLKIPTLVEKPIADTVENATEMLNLAKKQQVNLLVGHIERFNPAVIRLKKLIDQGAIGKVISILARRVGGFPYRIRDVDVAVDLAIHDIDILNYLLDSEPYEVFINKRKNHTKSRDDYVEFYLQYPQATAFIQANWITPVKVRKLNITGTEGYIEMDYISQKLTFYKSIYEKYVENTQDFSEFILKFADPEKRDIYIQKKEPLKKELTYFLSCVEKGKIVDSTYALSALKIALTKN